MFCKQSLQDDVFKALPVLRADDLEFLDERTGTPWATDGAKNYSLSMLRMLF